MYAHEHAVDGTAQAVSHHAVDRHPIAEAAAEALVSSSTGTRHRLHAACNHNVRIAGTDEQRAEIHRLQRAGADLVTVNDENARRQAGAEPCLPRRHLPCPAASTMPMIS